MLIIVGEQKEEHLTTKTLKHPKCKHSVHSHAFYQRYLHNTSDYRFTQSRHIQVFAEMGKNRMKKCFFFYLSTKEITYKFKLTWTGLSLPCDISIRLICNGSSFGMAKAACPSGCWWTMSVMTFGRQTVSPGLHWGMSLATVNNINKLIKWVEKRIHFSVSFVN